LVQRRLDAESSPIVWFDSALFACNRLIHVCHRIAAMRAAFLISPVIFSAALCAQAPQQVPNSSAIVPEERVEKSFEPGTFPDFPPLPRSQVGLIGGTVARVDPIRDRMVIRAFGGREFNVDFDVRTRILHGGQTATIAALKPGTRVYADTILNKDRIFAKTVRIDASTASGEAQGQVIAYDPSQMVLKIRDVVSSQPFSLRVDSRTEVISDGKAVSAGDLIAGTLIKAKFHAVGSGPSAAERIDVLARPGGSFTFAGKIAVIDFRDAHLTLFETSGDNTFEVGMKSLSKDDRLRLKQGMDVIVRATFDGEQYQAQSIEPAPGTAP
jgi:hypothetical protein